GDSAGGEVRHALEVLTGEVVPFVHGDEQLDQGNRVQVKHGLGVRVVAVLGRVAAHAHHRRDAEVRSCQQVPLHGDAVAVARRELKYRLDAALLESVSDSQRA